MFRKNLLKTIGEIKTPERRLNVLMPVLAVLALASVIYFLYTQDNNNVKQQIKELKDEVVQLRKDNARLQFEKDSVIQRDYNDKTEIYKKLEYYITTQNHNKKILRSK